jgi:glycosyltransferase involved in cell wall biosynthesis
MGRLTIALPPAAEKLPHQDHRLLATTGDVIPLPELPTIARGFGKVSACRRVIREVERRSDVLIVQLPFECPLALLGARTPRVYHICGNIWEIATRSPRFGGWKRLPASAMGLLIDQLQSRLFRRSDVRVVTNGAEVRAHFGRPPGQAVLSSTIRDEEILSVERERPADGPFRVLYVGFIRPEKGIDLLVSAFDRVLEVLPDAELEIVAARDGSSRGIGAEFEQTLTTLGRKGTVRFLGHRKYGPELFRCFADADVLVVPSRSEGTPRVLVDARAFGCPTIGTTVGGIPSSIIDGVDGLLVPPNNSQALADAILRLARDRGLRERLIAAGINRARQSTVEVFARVLADETTSVVANTGRLNR